MNICGSREVVSLPLVGGETTTIVNHWIEFDDLDLKVF